MNQAPASPRRAMPWGRVLDVLVVALVLFVGWRVFIAPRMLAAPGAYPAPHAVFARLHGGAPFQLAAQHGHVLFLDFFATWCTPCRAELPLVQAWERAHPQAAVMAIDVGEPRVAVHGFAIAHDMHGVLLDPQQLSRGFFALYGFPTMVVIDSHGDIRATWTGFNPAIGFAMSHALAALTKK